MGEKIDFNKIDANKLEEIFLLGDSRYDLINLSKIYSFFSENALSMEKEEIEKVDKTFNIEEVDGPQKLQKSYALKLLKEKNLGFEGFEVDLGWGRTDILACDRDKQLVAIECGPCRLNKAINYFRIENLKELWLIHIYSDEKTLYIIKRGVNWERQLEILDNKNMEQLRKIKSPLDNLNNN